MIYFGTHSVDGTESRENGIFLFVSSIIEKNSERAFPFSFLFSFPTLLSALDRFENFDERMFRDYIPFL